MSQTMDTNDTTPEIDSTLSLQETAQVQEIYLENDDDDVHVCRKCNIIFYDVQKYLEHKVKHDNFKVRYCRSSLDKRMVVPKLVQKQQKKDLQTEKPDTENEKLDDKENDTVSKKRKVGRKRIVEMHTSELIITERAGYTCSKCDRKFNREASLKRHLEYDHKEENEEEKDEDEMEAEEDSDQEYKPNKEEILEEDAETGIHMHEIPEMDSLDRVIMAAALVEKAEAEGLEAQQNNLQVQDQTAQSDGSTQTSVVVGSVQTDTGGHLPGQGKPQTRYITRRFGMRRLPQQAGRLGGKLQKLSEIDKAQRKYVCSICGNKFKELAVLKTHMLTHTNKRQFVCRVEGCPYAFKTKGSLKRHMRRHTGERPYGCELCGRSFAESGALTRHLKSRTSCTNKSDDELPRYGKKWAFTPNIPATQSRLLKQLNQDRHKTDKVNEANKDDEPPEITETSTEEQTSKEPEVIYIYPQGVKATSDTEQVVSHMPSLAEATEKEMFGIETGGNEEIVVTADAVEHDGDAAEDVVADDGTEEFVVSETVVQDTEPVKCKVCDQVFQSEETLRVHLYTHLADTNCKCPQCHFVTDDKEEFESHMLQYHNVQLKHTVGLSDLAAETEEDAESVSAKTATIRNAQVAVKQLMELPHGPEEGDSYTNSLPAYKCPVCQKSFRESSYLKMHMRYHTGVRPHKCDQCDKSFITEDALTKHLTSHQDDRNFKCGKCGKLFKRLGHVREHIRIHSEHRPFPCTVCEKAFKTSNAMKVHLRTHTDILPYECSYCHRRFREKGSVIRHMRMHTGEKPFACKHCGKRFAEHGTLNRHMKAKSSCKKNVIPDRLIIDELSKDATDYTVLAEFSSVVADTQQYIVPEGGEQENTSQESGTDQAPEYLVVQTKVDDHTEENVEVQNVQIVTDADGKAATEGLQVSDDYFIINDQDASCIRIMDSKTGEVVAVLPSESSDNQIQSITMSEEGEVSMVTLLAPGDEETIAEMVPSDALLETVDDNIHVIAGKQDTEQVHVIGGEGLEHAVVQEIIASVHPDDLVTDVAMETSEHELNMNEDTSVEEN